MIDVNIQGVRAKFNYMPEKLVPYEHGATKAILDTLALEGGNFADVGCWIGWYSVLASKYAKRVYAFDPNPIAIKRTEENIKLNNLENVRVFQHAVHAGAGQTTIGSGNGPGVRTGLGANKVETVTLDEFFRYRGYPTAIKIDVNGDEVAVLRGAEKVLERKPTIVISVYGRLALSPVKVARFLEDRDYTIRYADSGAYFVRAPGLPDNILLVAT